MLHFSGILDPSPLLIGAGPWALALIAVIILIETGLLFPFLPGDSLVFAAALAAPALGLPLWAIMLTVAVAAIVGDSLGYAIGARWGRRLFRPDARVFNTRYLDRADAFFARYGAQSLVLARFVPIVRTFVPPVVGASRLRYRRFLTWNIIGGAAWSVVLCLAGALLGQIPLVADNIEAIAVVIVVLSVLPIAISLIRQRRRRSDGADATGAATTDTARR